MECVILRSGCRRFVGGVFKWITRIQGGVGMATKNFFDLLGDDENEDPSQVVVRANSVLAEAKPPVGAMKKPAAPSKMSTKTTLSAEAAKDIYRGQSDGGKVGRGGGRGGRGGRGNFNDRDGASREVGGYRERNNNTVRSIGQTRDADGFVGTRSFVEKSIRTEDGEGRAFEVSRGGGRVRGRGGRGHSEGEERSRRREFDRHSGNARGNETEKRAGAGRGNWGTDVDSTLILDTVVSVKTEEVSSVEVGLQSKIELVVSGDCVVEEGAPEAVREEDEEDNEMTLEEYEKLLELKRKSLEAKKVSERKVEVDKAFEKMYLVENKKREQDVFIKLGQDKEKVKREAAERDEKSRKPVSINEFLKPIEGEKYYGPLPTRGRGGRGVRSERRESGDRREGGVRGDRDIIRSTFVGGKFGGSRVPSDGSSAPKIEDQSQFPTLGGK
ncbi:hypothetical protein KC19_VG184200 [Ceratodon purpureus]|uniref:Hyaluronan/mRNA-binding protein domain-containing protein n=2 Tax=Ceratodon purpureus TaxID=3225 RepID=A0A8T0HSI2_CERPU|nr:hypothetical protein KC19_VG184200 [Ceratodon purpureus]